jgi:hypothetical protein
MDAIYLSAHLTLIAAAGVDPSRGLPGVSEARHRTYRYASIGDVRNTTYRMGCDIGEVRVSYQPTTAHRAITRSRWFTRGWTLQEGYLSRRRLYFTESAVTFICDQWQDYEGFKHPDAGDDGSLLQGTLNTRAIWTTDNKHGGLTDIMKLLEQYSERTLSYDSDALNAISGLLNHHCTEDQSIGTTWGIPHQLSLANQRIICINWYHTSKPSPWTPAIRRSGYPSWSPLGWIRPVEFLDAPYQFVLSEEDAAGISNREKNERKDWSLLKTSPHLRITVSVHRISVVNLENPSAGYVAALNYVGPKVFLMLPIGGTKGNGDDPKIYLQVRWDTAPPDHYDNSEVLCAASWSHDLQYLSMMVLKDHGTHYERIGFASAKSGWHDALKAAGLEELVCRCSTTNGIPTLGLSYNPDHDWTAEEDLAWLRDAEKTAITLG